MLRRVQEPMTDPETIAQIEADFAGETPIREAAKALSLIIVDQRPPSDNRVIALDLIRTAVKMAEIEPH